MSFSVEALIQIVVNVAIIIIWAVRLEMKVKHLRNDFDKGQTFRDQKMQEGRQDSHDVIIKLDKLNADVAKIQGILAIIAKNNLKGDSS